MLYSMAQAKAANQAAGGTWFHPDTMRYWGTTISTALVYPVSDGVLFVTGNRPGSVVARSWSVHWCSDGGRITSLWLPVGSDGSGEGFDSTPFLEMYRARTAADAHRVARVCQGVWPASASGGGFTRAVMDAVSAGLAGGAVGRGSAEPLEGGPDPSGRTSVVILDTTP